MSAENFVRFILLIYPAVLVVAHVLDRTTRPGSRAARIGLGRPSPANVHKAHLSIRGDAARLS
jgi:hypothetical protein